MSDPSGSADSALTRGLTDADREVFSGSIAAVKESGQTRWIARVVESRVGDPLDYYARAGTTDRFLWSHSEERRSMVAVGVVDEMESSGSSRFADARAWMSSVRQRIDWIGDARGEGEATFFGGFGFEETSRGGEEWKSFPAARFFLPEVIAERNGEEGRWVFLARINAASTAESVEADLEARAAISVSWIREIQPSPENEADRLDSLLSDSSREWPSGPEFRVQSDRSHDVFRAQVRRAIAAIEKGELSKVVLGRSLAVDHDGDLDVADFLQRLRSLYPTCTLIAMGRGQDTFLAATPETLIRVNGRDVRTAALAGSAPRGRHPDEDRVFAEALCASEKEREEHRHVVDAIRDALESECDALEVPAEPSLRVLFGIQHLETSIQGALKSGPKGKDILGLVERLHPTPAVGGVPRERAERWLVQNEGLDRGWYASPIGWLDLEGGGDFRVALRSALIRNGIGELGTIGASRARLFAGAGIVADSDPDQELAETRIKLRALLAPLTEI